MQDRLAAVHVVYAAKRQCFLLLDFWTSLLSCENEVSIVDGRVTQCSSSLADLI
jgi:hypothetical protein